MERSFGLRNGSKDVDLGRFAQVALSDPQGQELLRRRFRKFWEQPSAGEQTVDSCFIFKWIRWGWDGMGWDGMEWVILFFQKSVSQFCMRSDVKHVAVNGFQPICITYGKFGLCTQSLMSSSTLTG